MTQAKRTPLVKNKSSKSAPERQALAPAVVRVHDLSGAVCIELSAKLRSIFDEKAVEEIVSDLESRVMTIIIRRPGDIAYLNFEVVTRDLGRTEESPAKPRKSSMRQPRNEP